MIELLKDYPITYEKFFGYAMNYGISEYDYSNAPDAQQALTLISWLGYRQTLPADYRGFLKTKLPEFEELCIKYPKPVDFLKEIGKLNFSERMEKYPELFNENLDPTILSSIKDAFDFSRIPTTVQKEVENTEFWNNVTQGGDAPF